MSVAAVGSANAYSFKWPLQADSTSSSSNANPTDALQSLFDAITGGSSGSSDPLMAALGQGSGSGSSDSSGSSSCGMPQFSPDTMSALLSMQSGQGGPAAGIAQDVIAKFDANGDGQVSQSEFEQAIGSGADQSGVDALFSKLDSNGDGSVSADELQSAMQKAHGGGHHHHVEASSDSGQQQGSDPLQALLSGASADGTSSQTSTNSDGSSTTTITYADGTKLEMTSPAASSDGSSNGSSGNPNQFNLGNLLKMMVNLQSQLASPTTNVSV